MVVISNAEIKAIILAEFIKVYGGNYDNIGFENSVRGAIILRDYQIKKAIMEPDLKITE